MNQLLTMLKWEFVLGHRYKIIYIAMLGAILYYIALVALPAFNTTFFLTMFLFFDPTLIGIMFVGALVLFEKNENTIQALIVTPMQTRNYFLAKIISLTILSIVAALLFLYLAHGFEFNYFYMLTGIILTSVFLILVGFIMVSRCHSINEYLVLMMIAMLILFLPPLLHGSGIYKNDIFYILPSQASITLFQGVFGEISINETIYGVVYLIFWIILCYYISKKAFYKHIVMEG
ncbi:MAG: ABC transporter permease [Candidatus Thermoplasmatota archaeon]|jgi:fluoroquinolone transport system permease protein|nr:ABC transporter permease [Candidatus Thermoplasmatota archaeon]